MKEIISESVSDTKKLGKQIANLLKEGDFLALVGELGSGKTIFVKGLASGLNVKNNKYVNSPSFVIIKEYTGRKRLYHFDIYRIKEEALLDVGIEEYFFADGIVAMEWADKAKRILPKEHLLLMFSILDDSRRKISLIPHGKRYRKIINKL